MGSMYALLKFVPKNSLSMLTGCLANVRIPSFLHQLLLHWYCRKYFVNLEEMELPLEAYHTLGAFFVRNLKAGVRPVGEGLVSPVDGKIQEHGVIEHDRLFQAKGKHYSLVDLVGSRQLAEKFNGGYYVTIYLAPGDYHHIHSPIEGKVTKSIYIPGTLWPVNQWSVRNVDNLFAINERLISVVSSTAGEILVVKVGATNVGSIGVEYDNFRTNSRFLRDNSAAVTREYPKPWIVAKGGRLGTFNLGSTVILIMEPGRFKPGDLKVGEGVKFGQTLGQW